MGYTVCRAHFCISQNRGFSTIPITDRTNMVGSPLRVSGLRVIGCAEKNHCAGLPVQGSSLGHCMSVTERFQVCHWCFLSLRSKYTWIQLRRGLGCSHV